MQLDHIGIAVTNLKESVEVFTALLGLEPKDINVREVPAEKVLIAEIHLPGAAVELMEPMAEDSPISNYLARRGQGVHHICYRTDDLDGVFARMQKQGARTLTDSIREVSLAYRYFFVHPKDAAGILTEFKQPL
jgi:methylmalonyl-CoA epimerase